MSVQRTERLLNLMYVLANTTRPLTKDELLRRVPGYSDSPKGESAARMFERDKEDLRLQGIPVEVTPTDPLFGDETGYVISRKEWLLPELSLTAMDSLLLTLATSAWSNVEIAEEAADALDRLVDPVEVVDFLPRLAKRQRHVEDFFEAIAEHKQVQFDYRNRETGEVVRREVEPWRLLISQGHWYVIGFDRVRGEQRVYRLTRIVGDVRVLADTIDNPCPPDLDSESLTHEWGRLYGEPVTVTVTVQHNSCTNLRAFASDIRVGEVTDDIVIDRLGVSLLSRHIAQVAQYVTNISDDSVRIAVRDVLNRAKQVHSD